MREGDREKGSARRAEHGGRKPELLAPGGSLEKCHIAFLYGADAVYVGGKELSLRALSRNLDHEELAHVRCAARRLGKKVYVTVNVFATERDLGILAPYLEYLSEIEVDGIIASDPGVIVLARRYAPGIPIHLSTQANTSNSESVLFWRDQGVSRINLARELSFDEMKTIRQRADIELETFVHGAMCMSYSGRCLLSAFLTGRSANRGLCTQPCRWSYRLVEEKRPGQYFPVEEDSRGTYIFNSKDLCLIDELGALTALGMDAFKVEGRMKGALYLATVVRSYRRAMDRYRECPEPQASRVEEKWRKELDRVSHRPYTKGMLRRDHGGADGEVSASVAYVQDYTLAGIVRPDPRLEWWEQPPGAGGSVPERVCIEVRSRLVRGMVLEFLSPDGRTIPYRLEHFEDLRGNTVSLAHPNTWITLSVPFGTFPLQVIRTRRRS